MSKAAPSIVDKILDKHKVSLLNDKEQKAWIAHFQSLIEKDGLSALDSEIKPLEKDLIRQNQEIETLIIDAKKMLSKALEEMNPATANLLISKISSGILTGEKYSYKWRGQEMVEINSLSEDDQKLLNGLNETESKMCMHTSAEIAAHNAKNARIKDVLKIAQKVKDDFIPGGTDTKKSNNDKLSVAADWMDPLAKKIGNIDKPTHEKVLKEIVSVDSDFKDEFDFKELKTPFAKGMKIKKKSVALALIHIYEKEHPPKEIKSYTAITKRYETPPRDYWK